MPDLPTLARRTALPAVGEVGAMASEAGAIAIRVLAPRTRLSLRLAPALAAEAAVAAGFALDLPINHCKANAERMAMRLGPDEWLLSCRESEAAQIARAIEVTLAGLGYSLVDVSHAYVGFAVAGAAAAETMNAGCPLDLWPGAFPAGQATRTLLGKAEIILARPGDAPGFELLCMRSLAAYVRDFLLEAARGIAALAERVR
jgi:sarcosine oxidase subunit gamma